MSVSWRRSLRAKRVKMIEFSSYKPTKLSDGTKMVEGKLIGNTKVAVGIDPGLNFGMTIIEGESVCVFWGKLPAHKETGLRGIEAYNYVKLGRLWDIKGPGRAVVEGAAYNKAHGQVGLEEVRFGFFLALHHLGFDVHILPPATARKMAFGSGKAMAYDIYPTVNHNGADSLGLALAALELYEKD